MTVRPPPPPLPLFGSTANPPTFPPDDYEAFKAVNAHLLNSSRELKNIPLRVYIPQSPDGAVATADGPGAFRVVQALVSPKLKERTSPHSPFSLSPPALLSSSHAQR